MSGAKPSKFTVDLPLLSSILNPPAGSSLSLIGSIDQGTSSSRFLLVTADGRILSQAQTEFEQIRPESSPFAKKGASCVGWHEHDPFGIWDSVARCIARTVEELAGRGLDLAGDGASLVKAVGITNQRETTIAWNNETGRLYYNAIVWDDTRTAAVADAIVGENSGKGGEGKDCLRPKTGLPVASYFAGTKVRWLIDHVPELRRDLTDPSERPHVRFGTIDTWLVYMLTGRDRSKPAGGERLAHEGGEFKTDVSNAGCWLFVNLETMDWDPSLVEAVCGGSDCWKGAGFGTLPATALPEIVPSSDSTIGSVRGVPLGGGRVALEGVAIASILGDQQAALFGQTCFRPGEAKCTYGTGLFLMMNTGDRPRPSAHGLLTTAAYQLRSPSGEVHPPVFILEGSVAFSGSTIGWLRDRVELVEDARDTEAIATSVPSSGGMYLVPAFSGLFAPHWRPDARGCVVGLTASHGRAHIVRAALEASAYQAGEVFEAMARDSGVRLREMRVDGGATANAFLMQFQSDVLDAPVVRPRSLESTGLGAAFAAGLATGVWGDLGEVAGMWKADRTWTPEMGPKERERAWRGWKKAVERSLNWVDEED